MKSKNVDVFININCIDIYVGILFVEVLRGKEIYSFEYDKNFLLRKKPIQIDPELPLIRGRQYKLDSSSIYGFIADAIPDRWGKNLLNRNEKYKAKEENRNPEKLGESDYLLGVNDYARQGALRFKIHGENNFLALGNKDSVPKMLFINKLEQLAFNIDINKNEDIVDLFSPGSSMGGSRPKATLFDNNKDLYIAKFSQKNDDYDFPKMELLANKLGSLCGLNITESRLIKGKRSIFLSKRFDRDKDRRIPYTSAMTLLQAKDGDSESYSYLDFVDLINKYSVNPEEDLLEMFKRLVFNCLIHNSDDHLRNHGFLMFDNGYRLSPVFDINPNPDSLGLSLTIDGYEHSFDLNCCASVAKYFGVSNKEAEDIIKNMQRIIIDNTNKISKEIGINRETLMKFDFLLK